MPSCRMELDTDKIDDAVLALLTLGASGKRAWKGFDATVLTRLHERGFISNPNDRKPTLELTEEGWARAKKKRDEFFGRGA